MRAPRFVVNVLPVIALAVLALALQTEAKSRVLRSVESPNSKCSGLACAPGYTMYEQDGDSCECVCNQICGDGTYLDRDACVCVGSGAEGCLNVPLCPAGSPFNPETCSCDIKLCIRTCKPGQAVRTFPCQCEYMVNLVYAIDSSDNTGIAHFNIMKKYVIEDARKRLYNAAPYSMKIGAVVGGHLGKELVYLDGNITSFAAKLDAIRFRGGKTDNVNSLTWALSLFVQRPLAEKRVLVALTSGNSKINPERIKSTGKFLKEYLVSTYAIGIGFRIKDDKDEELRAIVGADLGPSGDALARSNIRTAGDFESWGLPSVIIPTEVRD